MTLPLWGLLQKAQDDAQTIDAAIAAAIVAHEADPTAHLGEGESLQEHKADEVIDHPASSVVGDKYQNGSIGLEKLLETRRLMLSNFASSDGFNTFGGTQFFVLGSVTARTDASTNGYASVTDDPASWVGFDISKYAMWQSTIRMAATDDVDFIWGYGTSAAWAGDDIGFGFRWDDGTLKVWKGFYPSGGGVSYEEQAISDVGLTDWHVYRIVYDPTGPSVQFFIDGTLVHTWTTTMPDTNADNRFILQAKTLENVQKYIYAADFIFTQDR